MNLNTTTSKTTNVNINTLLKKISSDNQINKSNKGSTGLVIAEQLRNNQKKQ